MSTRQVAVLAKNRAHWAQMAIFLLTAIKPSNLLAQSVAFLKPQRKVRAQCSKLFLYSKSKVKLFEESFIR